MCVLWLHAAFSCDAAEAHRAAAAGMWGDNIARPLQPDWWNATQGTTVRVLVDGTKLWRQVRRADEERVTIGCLATAAHVDWAMSEHGATEALVAAEGAAIVGVDLECAVGEGRMPSNPLLTCLEGGRLEWWCGFIKCASLATDVYSNLTCSGEVVRAGYACRVRLYVARCPTVRHEWSAGEESDD
jgi:hypothetical protein